MTPLEAAEALPFVSDEAVARHYAAKALRASEAAAAAEKDMREAPAAVLPEIYAQVRDATRLAGQYADVARAICYSMQCDPTGEIAKNVLTIWHLARTARKAQAIYAERVTHAA